MEVMQVEFIIKIHQSKYGYDVSCPTLKGCHSQGETRDKAIDNIKIAIKEYLEVLKELNEGEKLELVEVAV